MKTTIKNFTAALAASTMFLAAPALAEPEQTSHVPDVEIPEEPAGDAKRTLPAPVADTKMAMAEMERDGPALWKVADEDTTIYLFGTVHALPKDVEWYNDAIAEALGSSQSIVTEIMMDDTMPAKMQQLVMAKGVYTDGTTLRSKLDDDQKAAYEGAMAKLGMRVHAFDTFEPWYAGMMMSMLPLLQQGYSPESGVEKVLFGKAADVDRAALETVEFQIGLFDGLPEDSQIDFLIEASKNIDTIKAQLDAMVAEWVEGDADALAELMNEGLTDDVLADQLLYMRNRNWAQWIDERLDTPGTVFMAVGAGHLAGQNSVQEALEDLEIETTRVQ